MNILLIIVLCLLATGKVTLQSAFSKKNVKTLPDTVLFIGLIFLFAAILFMKDLFASSPETFLFGSLFGIFTVCFQLTYTKALASGNVSLTVMFVNFSMIIPIFFSCVMYKESLTPLGTIGILCTFLSFFMCINLKEEKEKNKLWLPLTLLTFLANGALSVTQKLFAHSESGSEGRAFVAVAYLVAAVLTLTLYAAFRTRGKQASYPISKSLFLYSGGVGIILAVFQAVNTYAVKTIPAGILYPSYSGGCIIASALCGILLFRDKLKKRQFFAILLGALAIVLMNL